MAISLNSSRLLLAAVAASAMLLSACADSVMDEPTALAEKRAEVHEGVFNQEFETSALTARNATLSTARHYRRYGHGPLEVTVTFNPASKSYTARSATEDAGRIARDFAANKVLDVKTDILPVGGEGPSKTMLHYGTHEARPPKDCQDAYNISDESADNFRDYKLGCTTETYIARQVDRPSDLLGRGGMAVETDGRRQAVIVGTYRSAPMGPMEDGLSPTDD